MRSNPTTRSLPITATTTTSANRSETMHNAYITLLRIQATHGVKLVSTDRGECIYEEGSGEEGEDRKVWSVWEGVSGVFRRKG